jgi:hypothetical protein
MAAAVSERPRSVSGYFWHPRARILSGAPVQMFYVSGRLLGGLPASRLRGL